MSAPWPLPQYRPLLEGYSESPGVNVIRTDMDAGPAKMRRRYTAVPRPVTACVMVAKSEVATLRAFYTSTLKSGTLPFDWLDFDGDSCTYRFVVKPDDPGITWESSSPPGLWKVSMKLEVMP